MKTPSHHREPGSRQALTELIESARSGDQDALNILISSSRAVVRERAQSRFPAGLQSRLDPSDVIQEVLLEASRDFPRFHGQSGREWQAWLETVLNNNLVECLRRHVDAAKRSVSRERSAEQILAGGRNSLSADDSSPSQVAMHAELRQRIRALQPQLTDDQRKILELRYWGGASLADIASAMNLSKSSAARLLRKSLEILRNQLSHRKDSDASPGSQQSSD